MQGVNLIDATGLEVVARLFERLRKQGLKIHIVGAKLEVEQSMKRVFTRWEEVRFHRTEQEALQAMESMRSDDAEQAKESS